MTKLETVRALNDSGPQLQIVESVRTLQQSVSLMHEDLKRLPGAVSTETAQTLEPLARLRQDVTQVLEAYDKVTAIQRKTLDELSERDRRILRRIAERTPVARDLSQLPECRTGGIAQALSGTGRAQAAAVTLEQRQAQPRF